MRAKYLGDIPTRALKRRSNWRALTPSSAAAAPTSGESASRRAASSTSESARPRSSARSAHSTSGKVARSARLVSPRSEAGTTRSVSSCIGMPSNWAAPPGRKRTPKMRVTPGARNSRGPVSCPARKHRGCVSQCPFCKDSNGCPKLRMSSGRPSGTTRWTVPGSGAFQHPIAFDQPARILTRSELPIVHICQDSCSRTINAG